MTEVVVIGAGPYGLSVAAHLRHSRIPCRVFGKPMSMWQHHAPKGMTLKSDAFASSFASPGNAYPLEQFYRDTGRTDYSHLGLRVPAQTLVEYGHEFQRRLVGEVEEAEVLQVARQATASRSSSTPAKACRRARWWSRSGCAPCATSPRSSPACRRRCCRTAPITTTSKSSRAAGSSWSAAASPRASLRPC